MHVNQETTQKIYPTIIIWNKKTNPIRDNAKKYILHGVGAFDYAMEKLHKSGMRDKLNKLVNDNGIPILGICVGMQMMAESSEEGKMSGLGWVKGEVKHFRHNIQRDNKKMDVPHMGWNTIKPVSKSPLMMGFSDNPRFYFLHSYYFLILKK